MSWIASPLQKIPALSSKDRLQHADSTSLRPRTRPPLRTRAHASETKTNIRAVKEDNTKNSVISRWAQASCSVLPAVAAGIMLVGASSMPALAEVLSGAPRVVDGDTLEVAGTRIRLFGMDAPESKQLCKTSKDKDYSCGVVAQEQLAAKIGKRKVACDVKNTDQYGRSVAVCSADGEDLNKWMVSSGNAVAYTEYSKSYVEAERQAQSAHKGIWEGTFERPSEWRKGNKRAAPSISAATTQAVVSGAPPHPKGCDIKGNINSKGEKIYHVPGGQFYEQTVIGSGERWLCDEKEAVAAGW
eukprot:CAMPEP_0198209486 /NCGR_PEP_ID=MMETSP1445-20131203/16310_1 /TAXON_ID=36898 /ORGANISM="Pyramimonas sp., Strain CCMP2087" /LENGTH=299 /DNA_ID=CAMNT_0043883275 /DNA_START=68 /DNA_END=964 /DNA_ORIENTATION=+